MKITLLTKILILLGLVTVVDTASYQFKKNHVEPLQIAHQQEIFSQTSALKRPNAEKRVVENKIINNLVNNQSASKATTTTSSTTSTMQSSTQEDLAMESSSTPVSTAVAWNTYTSRDFGFISFRYPSDFSLSQKTNDQATEIQYNVPRLSLLLERTGSYFLDRSMHNYRELIEIDMYDRGKEWAEGYFTKDSATTLGGLQGWKTERSGSEQFIQVFTSKEPYVYVFQLHSTKPRWLQGSEDESSSGVFNKVLSTVRFTQ
jgi:hypothetical protein